MTATASAVQYPVFPKQAAYLRYTKKVGGIRGGVGSGKSTVNALWMINRMAEYPDGVHYVIGADYPQLKRGFLKTFLTLLDRFGIAYTYKSTDGTVTLDEYGSQLLCLSAQLEERIRSVEYDSVLLEEPQTWECDAAELYKTILGRLRGSPEGIKAYGDALQPQMRLSFNPPAKSHWLFEVIEKQWPKDGYECWQFSVRENYTMGIARQAEYIRLLESTYSEDRWSSEIDGNWKDVGGSVYCNFARWSHAEKFPDELPPLGWNVGPDKPMWWTLDFNVAWMASLIGQVHVQPMVTKGIRPIDQYSTVLERVVGPAVDGWQRRIHDVLGEIFLKDSNASLVVARFVEEYQRITGAQFGHVPVWIYGDPAGGSRQQGYSTSNYQIIGHALQQCGIPYVWRVMKADPGQINRVNAANLQLREGSLVGGRRGVRIDAQACPNFVNDLEAVQWSKKIENSIDKSDQSESGKKLTHLTDAYAYMAFVDRAQSNGVELDYPNWMER